MALEDAGHRTGQNDLRSHGEKSVAEHGLCFGSALAILAVAAYGLQWLISALA